MNITVIGSGYVGLVSGGCFAEFGFNVICVDKDKGKIDHLNEGKIPIYEPGLEDLIVRNIGTGRLKFTTDMAASLPEADVVLIAVGTPAQPDDGDADLSHVYGVSTEIAPHLKGHSVIVTKSTVPVGTGRQIESLIKEANPDADIDIASNPEFLREGSAINDFMDPDRIVVGVSSARAEEVMHALYRPLLLRDTPILSTTIESAELIKYASNAFLAVKISYINQMADLCERLGGNIHDVAKGMGLDERIGSKFLQAGPGYGGSCFPKDTMALVKTAQSVGCDASLVDEVVRYNAGRKIAMAGRVIAGAGGSVKGKTIAVLGLAFKCETDDMRESAALDIIPQLIEQGARIKAYDPAAMEQAVKLLPKAVEYQDNVLACLDGADVAVVITEWNEFRTLTSDVLKQAMAGRVIVDLRNIFEPDEMLKAGFDYHNIGMTNKGV